MANLGYDNYPDFRRAVLKETGVSFCTRLHFGRELPGEKNRYIRLAYSGIDVDQMEEGLGRLKKFVEKGR
jgi:aspartate/methionine/tyrosine aminotransferase